MRAAPAMALLAAVLLAPAPVRAVDVDWGRPEATSVWGEHVEFRQPATLPGDLRRMEVLLEFPGALGPVVEEIPAPRAGEQVLEYSLELADGHLLPNTTVGARWRAVGNDGSETTGPAVSVRYEDTRFDWRTREGEVVRVHWYDGPDGFGQRALEIGERAIRETTELLGVTEEDPVDFYIYAGEREFLDALGPGTRENVGGQANPEIRTLFALISPGQINDSWVAIVVPHELVHLVYDTTVDNPYHDPPHWLNEGLADYLSTGYSPEYRTMVETAVRANSVTPLDGLSGLFRTGDRALLAYAHSVAVVDYLVREHGRDTFVQLVRSYANGLTDDEAFEQAIGMTVAELDAAWRESVGAGEPAGFGPQPAPAGPLPPGWETAEGSPGATLPPRPGSSPVPNAPIPGAPTQGADTLPIVLGVLGAAILAAVGGVLWFVARERRRAERARVAQFAAWRDERSFGPRADPLAGPAAGRVAGTASHEPAATPAVHPAATTPDPDAPSEGSPPSADPRP